MYYELCRHYELVAKNFNCNWWSKYENHNYLPKKLYVYIVLTHLHAPHTTEYMPYNYDVHITGKIPKKKKKGNLKLYNDPEVQVH